MKGNFSVSHIYCSHKEDYVSLRIMDEDSRIEFVDLKLSHKQFAEALLGLSNVPCELEVKDLHKVGKKVITENFEFKMPEYTYRNMKRIARRTVRKLCGDEWEPSLHFDSQKSFFEIDGETWACTVRRKWIEK